MANQEYNKETLKKAGAIILSIGGVLALVYFIGSFNTAEPLPQEFVKEYKEAVAGSKEVAEISNSVAKKVEEVNKLDTEGKTSSALDVIETAKDENKEAKKKASELLSRLEGLTEMVLEMESNSRKRDLAGAVQAELVLIDEFINYTSDMENFLGSLSLAVVSDEAADEEAVQRNLEMVNEKRQTINDLSDRFLAKTSQLGIFD